MSKTAENLQKHEYEDKSKINLEINTVQSDRSESTNETLDVKSEEENDGINESLHEQSQEIIKTQDKDKKLYEWSVENDETQDEQSEEINESLNEQSQKINESLNEQNQEINKSLNEQNQEINKTQDKRYQKNDETQDEWSLEKDETLDWSIDLDEEFDQPATFNINPKMFQKLTTEENCKPVLQTESPIPFEEINIKLSKNKHDKNNLDHKHLQKMFAKLDEESREISAVGDTNDKNNQNIEKSTIPKSSSQSANASFGQTDFNSHIKDTSLKEIEIIDEQNTGEEASTKTKTSSIEINRHNPESSNEKEQDMEPEGCCLRLRAKLKFVDSVMYVISMLITVWALIEFGQRCNSENRKGVGCLLIYKLAQMITSMGFFLLCVLFVRHMMHLQHPLIYLAYSLYYRFTEFIFFSKSLTKTFKEFERREKNGMEKLQSDLITTLFESVQCGLGIAILPVAIELRLIGGIFTGLLSVVSYLMFFITIPMYGCCNYLKINTRLDKQLFCGSFLASIVIPAVIIGCAQATKHVCSNLCFVSLTNSTIVK